MPNEKSASNPVSIDSILEEYSRLLSDEFSERAAMWPRDAEHFQEREVVGGLLSRQITLAMEMASNPSVWSAHVAPLFLRAMTDVHITLAWIIQSSAERAREYVRYGLGQEKLLVEHLKSYVEASDGSPSLREAIRAQEGWLNSQRLTVLTEVNVGSWSGMDTRSMAEAAGCLDLYRFAYCPFSAAVHSTWQHVSRYNLIPCNNPLHGWHREPVLPEPELDADYMYRAAKYAAKSLALFDTYCSPVISSPSAFSFIANALTVEDRWDPEWSHEAQSAQSNETNDSLGTD